MCVIREVHCLDVEEAFCILRREASRPLLAHCYGQRCVVAGVHVQEEGNFEADRYWQPVVLRLTGVVWAADLRMSSWRVVAVVIMSKLDEVPGGPFVQARPA